MGKLKARIIDSRIIPWALFAETSYLRKSGWLRSYFSRKPIDRDGTALPWYTYSCIEFLRSKSEKLTNCSIFEYGGGFSTVWWSQYASSIDTVDDNEEWVEKIKEMIQETHVKVKFENSDNESYWNAIKLQNNIYDIAIVDGRCRNKCAQAIIDLPSSPSVVIWDNSERDRYAIGKRSLVEAGYKYIDFSGLGPAGVIPWTTTVFYKSQNVLDI